MRHALDKQGQAARRGRGVEEPVHRRVRVVGAGIPHREEGDSAGGVEERVEEWVGEVGCRGHGSGGGGREFDIPVFGGKGVEGGYY